MMPIAKDMQSSETQPATTETKAVHDLRPWPFPLFIRSTEFAVRLTPREKEVMLWTAEGKTAYEVGIILGISIGTVNFHVNNLIAKFGVRNKIQAAVHAALLGLLSWPVPHHSYLVCESQTARIPCASLLVTHAKSK